MLKAIHYGRIAAFTALLVLGFLLLEIRLFYLQILRHDDLGSRAGKYEGYRRLSASWRGEIRARFARIGRRSWPAFSPPCWACPWRKPPEN